MLGLCRGWWTVVERVQLIGKSGTLLLCSCDVFRFVFCNYQLFITVSFMSLKMFSILSYRQPKVTPRGLVNRWWHCVRGWLHCAVSRGSEMQQHYSVINIWIEWRHRLSCPQGVITNCSITK
jgi:hypothetical protein